MVGPPHPNAPTRGLCLIGSLSLLIASLSVFIADSSESEGDANFMDVKDGALMGAIFAAVMGIFLAILEPKDGGAPAVFLASYVTFFVDASLEAKLGRHNTYLCTIPLCSLILGLVMKQDEAAAAPRQSRSKSPAKKKKATTKRSKTPAKKSPPSTPSKAKKTNSPTKKKAKSPKEKKAKSPKEKKAKSPIASAKKAAKACPKTGIYYTKIKWGGKKYEGWIDFADRGKGKNKGSYEFHFSGKKYEEGDVVAWVKPEEMNDPLDPAYFSDDE